MKNVLIKAALLAACSGAMLVTTQAEAANWLLLQGSEPTGTAGRAKVWGFLQPTYQKDYSDITSAPRPEPTRIGPNLENQSQFQLQRARIGVRGTAMPIDSNVDYFIMAEFGHNAATDGGIYGERTPVRLMDASVTLNHIKGARIRTGLFKTPGSEEILQGIVNLNYINFTWAANQLLLERFSRGVVNGNADGVLAPSEFQWDSTFGAGRDIGVQVFDAFPVGAWEHSYAVMVGNGNGLEPGRATFGDGGSGSAKLDTYLYWSSEWVFGGEGPRREGWKSYIWSQTGERDFDATDDGAVNPTTHDRKRMGVGTYYRRGDWRLAGEYIKAEGMIFQGPEKPWFGIQNNGTSINPANLDLDGEADGWSVDVGYYIPGTKWELDARYDVLHRSSDHDNISADFKSLTGGIQYHLNKKSRITLNYENREMEALDATAPVGALAKGAPKVADRLGVQLTVIF